MEACKASGSEASGFARSPSYDSVAAEAEAAEVEAAAAEEQAAGVQAQAAGVQAQAAGVQAQAAGVQAQAQAAGEPACVGAARDAREAAHHRWGMQPTDEASSCESCGFDACEPR